MEVKLTLEYKERTSGVTKQLLHDVEAGIFSRWFRKSLVSFMYDAVQINVF